MGKDIVFSYDKDMSAVNTVAFSANTDIVVLYTHFMRNGSNHWNMTMHSHAFYELHIVLSGNCVMSMKDGDTYLSENECIIIAPREKHRFKECSEDFFRLSVAFDIMCGNERTFTVKLVSHQLDESCSFYAKNILREYRECAQGCKTVANALIAVLLIRILRTADTEDDFFAHTGNKVLANAVRFIDNNISRGITAADTAAEAYMSVRHMNRLFSENFGMTVSRYIKMKKIDNAKEYLEKTNLSIKEIASLTGSRDEAAFCKFFRNETGTTPKAYRKEYRSGIV